jgi:hypothetical protein
VIRGRIGPVYRLATELQALAPLWILPESKAVRGWHLRTGQTEGGQLTQIPELGQRVLAAAAFHEILAATLGHLIANIGATLPVVRAAPRRRCCGTVQRRIATLRRNLRGST